MPPFEPDALRICSDGSYLEALRIILMSGIAIAIGTLFIDAWQKGLKTPSGVDQRVKEDRQQPDAEEKSEDSED